MKLHAEIAGDKHAVDLRLEGSRVSAQIDGRSYELDVHESGGGSHFLIADGQVFDIRVDGRPESGNPVDVFVGANHYSVTLTDPKRLRGATATGPHADGVARIIAPMPGKVVRVLVSAGDRVETGDGIIVVEAMKMQNEMKSPKAGTVVALNAEVGATVNGGDVLAVVE
jgi:biotin carboxyl carrier protein